MNIFLPTRHARDMTDAEFDAAFKTKAWRNPPPPAATPGAPPPPVTSTSSASPPPPPTPSVPALKHASEMTQAEFDAAFRAKAWRGTPVTGV